MTEIAVLTGVVALTAGLAVWWRSRDGAVRTVDDHFAATELAGLGAAPGRWVLLEFTAPSCAPCAAARRVLDDVADGQHTVTVATVDVSAHPDAARAHGVLRTPTTFVVDAGGRVRGRIAGVPASRDVVALLGDGTPPADRAA